MRNALNGTTALAIALAACIPFIGLAQTAVEPDADGGERQQIVEQAVERIVGRIEQIQAEDPESPDLIDPLATLASLLQESGDYDLALATRERAQAIMRRAHGLHSLEEASLIRQSMRMEEAAGNADRAWNLEQELLGVVRRHPDDLRTVPILREIADRRLAALDRYLAGEFPPEMVLGCYFNWDRGPEAGSCTSGLRDDAVRSLILDAQRSYADAIAVLLRNERYSSAELRSLELELAHSSDLFRELDGVHYAPRSEFFRGRHASETIEALLHLANWNLPKPNDGVPTEPREPAEPETVLTRIPGPYWFGRASLQRLFAYAATTSSSQSQIDALVQLADWDLLYSRNGKALEGYELAYRILEEMHADQASIDGLFAPEMPVVLPSFADNPLVADESRKSGGYVDVSFEITRLGESRRVEIVDATADATDADKNEVVRLVRDSRYRPRLTNGRFARTSPIVVRYYLQE